MRYIYIYVWYRYVNDTKLLPCGALVIDPFLDPKACQYYFGGVLFGGLSKVMEPFQEAKLPFCRSRPVIDLFL